jgi:hypothetical protein
LTIDKEDLHVALELALAIAAQNDNDDRETEQCAMLSSLWDQAGRRMRTAGGGIQPFLAVLSVLPEIATRYSALSEHRGAALQALAKRQAAEVRVLAKRLPQGRREEITLWAYEYALGDDEKKSALMLEVVAPERPAPLELPDAPP